MAINITYVNKLMIVVSNSHWIRFVTVDYVYDRSKATLMLPTKNRINLYYKCMFKVTILLMDADFETMWYNIDALKGPCNQHHIN